MLTKKRIDSELAENGESGETGVVKARELTYYFRRAESKEKRKSVRRRG